MNEYLTRTLLPLIVTIQPKKSESDLVDALGLELNSSQSILITTGNRIEQFWNIVISDSKSDNLIEKVNLVAVNGKDRQIDHHFKCYLDGLFYYLESKCNTNLDSEKVKASNKKVGEVKCALNANVGAYFKPVVSVPSAADLTKFNNKGVDIYGVKWMLSKIDAQFTEEEYFTFLREVVAPILVEKGL
jgi:hypothetical protein